jgi:hypothetical protein
MYGDVTAVAGIGNSKCQIVEELLEDKRGYISLESEKNDQRSCGGIKMLCHFKGSLFKHAAAYGVAAGLINVTMKLLKAHTDYYDGTQIFNTQFSYQVQHNSPSSSAINPWLTAGFYLMHGFFPCLSVFASLYTLLVCTDRS